MSYKSRKFYNNGRNLFFIILLISFFKLKENIVNATEEGDEITNWAETFGQELWNLGQKMTKSSEIKAKYSQYNARVEEKDGNALITSIVENVGRMLSRKIEAVKAILEVAEDRAEMYEFNETSVDNLTYYSSKYSEVEGEPSPEMQDVINETRCMYIDMVTNPDSHFFNISVNTEHSSVHVPTNVYDRSPPAVAAIEWSKHLDPTFVNNYKTDPALSWQYFCSETGLLRHYPAMRWNENEVDVYDCRRRSWYIETATCSKDVIILVDSSGSMRGFRNHIAKMTVRKIMDTFSNNDFLNIYNYSADISQLVPCFEDDLVQATPENTKVFYDAMQKIQPEGYANLSNAFIKAFNVLERYRDERRCNESASGCNQLIMLITDGVAGNLTEVFDEYNRIETENGTKIPVRVFTYLLGQEVTKVREIQWMACLNRGYYSHIKTLDEVSEDVLKYVNVIATPLVLQGEAHPPTWTHAFSDETNKLYPNSSTQRLMIAVGVPAFDRRANRQNETKTAKLLGVAGTDVPVDDIEKLTLPYKLGVNGYSFIVSNNGYVLLHPDLRPMSHNRLKLNYNSIDFTEVEQINDGHGPRDPGELLINLREALVNVSSVGNMTNVPVCFHYDGMRRVAPAEQDYYFAPLPNTPFALGVVIPSLYGNTWFKVGDEITKNRNLRINMGDYFLGLNWKIHPEWVYCKYHYLEHHDFDTPELELLEFLDKLNDPKFKWAEQYNENNTKLDIDAYYCNKELVQLLVFDAKITNTSYGEWKFENDNDKFLINSYSATLRFVGTMSGLTRWQFIHGEIEVDSDIEFGDRHTTAVDETWYKSAVLQYNIDPESFVYSVPHRSEIHNDDIQVTASHAIFRQDGGLFAPGCVVGFEFSQSLMYSRFMNITSKTKCEDCISTCDSDDMECFVIDNNGYILLSENKTNIGVFFGEVEGAIMEAMVEAEIFNNYTIYDLQALCTQTVQDKSSSIQSSMNPFRLVLMGINYYLTEFFWYFSRVRMWAFGGDEHKFMINLNEEETTTQSQRRLKKGQNQEEEDYFNRKIEIKWITNYYACDKQSTLYIFNQTKLMKGSGFSVEGPTTCSEPYFVKRIPHSNLLLIAVKKLYPSCYRKLSTAPEIIELKETEFPCHKLNLNELKRRRLEECFTEHPEEAEIKTCGNGVNLQIKLVAIIVSLFNFVKLFKLF